MQFHGQPQLSLTMSEVPPAHPSFTAEQKQQNLSGIDEINHFLSTLPLNAPKGILQRHIVRSAIQAVTEMKNNNDERSVFINTSDRGDATVRAAHQFARPILVDGLLLARDYDHHFQSSWSHLTSSTSSRRSRNHSRRPATLAALPVTALTRLALRITLLGHKLLIYLPKG